MKKCPNCKADVDDNFDLCWNCQYSFIDNRVLQQTEFSEDCPNCNQPVSPDSEYCPHCNTKLGIEINNADRDDLLNAKQIDCLRCKIPMMFKENMKFEPSPGFLTAGGIFELFRDKESFDVYYCPQCGKVEFFLPLV